MMKRLINILCVLFVVVALTGCGSSRKNADTGLTKQELSAAKTRYESVTGHNLSYDILQAKTRYSFNGKSLGGKLYVEHGKRLCMTVTMLGIELARIEADRNDVFVVDKFDKIYVKASVSDFASKLGLQDEADFDALEALFLGQIYVPGHGIAQANDFKRLAWSTAEDGTLQGAYRTGRYSLLYDIDVNDYLARTSVSLPDGKASVAWNYSSWSQAGSGFLPMAQTLTAISGDVNLTAQITLSSVSVGQKGWNPFSAAGYREVSFAEFIQTIKKVAG